MEEKARKQPQKSIIERVAQGEGVVNFVDFEAKSDELKFRVYKVTLREVENILKQEDIAKRSLSAVKTALNSIENGFYSLLSNPKFNKKRDIKKVMQKLIDAKARLQFALSELKKGETYEYFQALGICKSLIFEINLQLKEPGEP